jgi:hypothetical protein
MLGLPVLVEIFDRSSLYSGSDTASPCATAISTYSSRRRLCSEAYPLLQGASLLKNPYEGGTPPLKLSGVTKPRMAALRTGLSWRLRDSR